LYYDQKEPADSDKLILKVVWFFNIAFPVTARNKDARCCVCWTETCSVLLCRIKVLRLTVYFVCV